MEKTLNYELEVVTVAADNENGHAVRYLETLPSRQTAEMRAAILISLSAEVTAVSQPRTAPGFQHLVYLGHAGIVGYANIAEVSND